MNKPVKKYSKASVSGFVFAFFSPLFIVLIFLLLYYNILSFYHPFGEWFYWLVVNILVAGTLVFNRAGIVFSLIGLINSFRKHTTIILIIITRVHFKQRAPILIFTLN